MNTVKIALEFKNRVSNKYVATSEWPYECSMLNVILSIEVTYCI